MEIHVTVFHIKYRTTNVFGALRKRESYVVYGYGVVTNGANSDDSNFGHFCYFMDFQLISVPEARTSTLKTAFTT